MGDDKLTIVLTGEWVAIYRGEKLYLQGWHLGIEEMLEAAGQSDWEEVLEELSIDHEVVTESEMDDSWLDTVCYPEPHFPEQLADVKRAG